MGTVGLALQWEHRISSVAGQGGSRVEPSETPAGRNREMNALADDAALAAGCLAGDVRAYERLYQLQGARMKNLARNLLGTPSDAEDAVQDTFLKVQRSIGSFRGHSSFVTWTYRILVNTCYDMMRKHSRRKAQTQEYGHETFQRRELPAPGGHPSLRIALERALAHITRQQRDVFLLYEVEGFRHAEIAAMLEISETASKNTLFQAKKKLRSMLEPPRTMEAGAR